METRSFGRYRLLELLGRGGMGNVWRAHDTSTDRIVALKVLPPHLADDEVFQKRFRREARVAAGLYEPHVVPIHDYGEIDGHLYVDMRLIVGENLEAIISRGPLRASRAVAIVEQVASALQAAHEEGLVHRDVKPSNILVTKNDFAYLIDFGIARATGSTGLTGTGSTIGTWAYMAPERFATGEPDPRSDVYALACVLFESLTGRRPFPGDSVEQQFAGHQSSPPPRPTDLNEAISQAFDEVIAKGMAKAVVDRFQTTTALAAAAKNALFEQESAKQRRDNAADETTRSAQSRSGAHTPPHDSPTVAADEPPVSGSGTVGTAQRAAHVPSSDRRVNSRSFNRGFAASLSVLFLALTALAVSGWMALNSDRSGQPTTPAFSESERTKAKAAACSAFNTVRAGIVQNTNLQPPGGPEDVVGTMAVAANARIALLEGGLYLRARTSAATPPELADAIQQFSETLMDIGAAATAGVPNTDPVQSTRLKDADAMSTGILALCA